MGDGNDVADAWRRAVCAAAEAFAEYGDALVGGAGTACAENGGGVEFFRIDEPPGAPGYLTAKE